MVIALHSFVFLLICYLKWGLLFCVLLQMHFQPCWCASHFTLELRSKVGRYIQNFSFAAASQLPACCFFSTYFKTTWLLICLSLQILRPENCIPHTFFSHTQNCTLSLLLAELLFTLLLSASFLRNAVVGSLFVHVWSIIGRRKSRFSLRKALKKKCE